MADLTSTIVIELSPELKGAIAEMQTKLDVLIEKLDKAAQPLEVKMCGRDLQGLIRTQDYRAGGAS